MNDITVYTLSVRNVCRYDISKLESALPKRMERSGHYHFEKDRLLCLAAGILLLEGLGLKSEDELSYGEYQKPYAQGFPAFNLSHSGGYAILAVGGDNIGADIEQADPAHIGIAPSVCSPRELQWQSEDPAVRFFRLWVLKESLMKATGLGIHLEPRTLDVLPFTRGEPVILGEKKWYARELSLDDCRSAVCSDAPIGEVRLVNIGG